MTPKHTLTTADWGTFRIWRASRWPWVRLAHRLRYHLPWTRRFPWLQRHVWLSIGTGEMVCARRKDVEHVR